MSENAAAAGEVPQPGGHLPDSAIVVRGGHMERGNLIDTAEACRRRYGFPGLSVYSWPDASVREIAFRVKAIRDRTGHPLLQHGDLRKSTAGRIRNAGSPDRHPFSLQKTGGEGHYTLRLPSPTTDEDWDLLDQTFDAPELNPVGLKANFGA